MRAVSLTALSLSLCAACTAEPVAVSPTNNRGVEVEQLFSHEGCTVYRFRDGAYHYYVRCAGAPPQTISQQSCGKKCSYEETIATHH